MGPAEGGALHDMVTTRRTLLKREPNSKKLVSLGPTFGNSPPCLGCLLTTMGWTKIQVRIGLAMSNRRHQKPNQPPKKPEPKKTLWDSIRTFLERNWKIIVLIFMLLTVMNWVYPLFWPPKANPKPYPRFE